MDDKLEVDIAAAFGASDVRDQRFAVYIPNKDRDGNPIKQEEWVLSMLRLLSEICGGATAMPPIRGAWLNPESGALVIEEPILIHAFIKAQAFADRLDEIVALVRRIGHETRQGQMAVEFNQAFYLIDIDWRGGGVTMSKVRFVSGAGRPVRILDTSRRAPKMDPAAFEKAFDAKPLGSSEGFDLFAIRDAMDKMLRSTGGRPALDGAVSQAKIPRIAADWEKLEQLLSVSAGMKHKPSVGQMAAMVLHLALGRIPEDELREAARKAFPWSENENGGVLAPPLVV
jgi:hypothetical protein